MDCTVHEIAKLIDHSLLQPSLTADELEQGHLPGPAVRRGQRLHPALLPAALLGAAGWIRTCCRAR